MRDYKVQQELKAKIPSRASMLDKLKKREKFDMLVIGGGATGAGVALDATLRGLNVALVERDDFSSSTSSRSTKLVHGGVRYLEKTVKELDPKQFNLVLEALHERWTLLKLAPHLTNCLEIMTPCYSWWEVPYYWIGMKMYDILSFRRHLKSSSYLSKSESLERFPMLDEQRGLKGSIIYYDGQMDDSRLNVALAMTAAMRGASMANHVEVIELLKEVKDMKLEKDRLVSPRLEGVEGSIPEVLKDEMKGVELEKEKKLDRVVGARVRDNLTNETWEIYADLVVNATGPYVDKVRRMDDESVVPLVMPSSGTHLVLPEYYASQSTGLIIPRTDDGRVIFVVPWQGKVIAGTTDTKCDLEYHPAPTEYEVEWILRSIAAYLRLEVSRDHVLAAWKGIRPLVSVESVDKSEKTQAIVRDHTVVVSPSNLLTVTGGKWTTYRKMAECVVDKALEILEKSDKMFHLRRQFGSCVTENYTLVGGNGWHPALFLDLIQRGVRAKYLKGDELNMKRETLLGHPETHVPMTVDIAQHLSRSYGSRAFLVADIARKNGYGKRLVHQYPFLEAEVVYAVKNEYACTAIDVLARRLRLAFLDVKATQDALPRTIEIMGKLLNWDSEKKKQEYEESMVFLRNMH
ncbi:glycerol-3-phosphate dehydrogenase, mitochondrial-like [Schistocerca gregaria]|uniref:glycerol-3-phosphate dehydrogenase, mitochondrial-like n=1 Tax=Schistocerca gregaria TaxID=7010 RepID=UPI00211DE149|nr:glycerol-3-phosphate dehydrogenase, mitochondrial-like [Schistocerca gregaria]